MLKKVIGYSLLFFALIALFLAGFGIKEADLSKPFIAFLTNTSREMEDWKIAIPDIPRIPKLTIIQTGSWAGDYLINFVNGWVTFINGVTGFLNILITILNTIIQLIEFIFFIIKNLITMKDTILRDSGTVVVN